MTKVSNSDSWDEFWVNALGKYHRIKPKCMFTAPMYISLNNSKTQETSTEKEAKVKGKNRLRWTQATQTGQRTAKATRAADSLQFIALPHPPINWVTGAHNGYVVKLIRKSLSPGNFDMGPTEIIYFSVNLSYVNLIIDQVENLQEQEGMFFYLFTCKVCYHKRILGKDSCLLSQKPVKAISLFGSTAPSSVGSVKPQPLSHK